MSRIARSMSSGECALDRLGAVADLATTSRSGSRLRTCPTPSRTEGVVVGDEEFRSRGAGSASAQGWLHRDLESNLDAAARARLDRGRGAADDQKRPLADAAGEAATTSGWPSSNPRPRCR